MKKFFKIIFGRMTLIALAIVAQIIVSIALPYILNYLYPNVFNKIYVQIDLIINILALVLIMILINSNMIVEGQLIWIIVILIFPLFGLVVYNMFVWHKAPKRHRKYYDQVKNKVTVMNKQTVQEKQELKED